MTHSESSAKRSPSSATWWLVGLLTCAALLRIGWLIRDHNALQTDPDAYVSLARSLVETGTFGFPGQPTAYRPPLYPVLLSGLFATGLPLLAVGIVHIACGLLTVWMTWRIAGYVASLRSQVLAASFVACDPLLVRYTSLPMTEVFCTTLVTGWLLLIVSRTVRKTETPPGIASAIAAGVLFGLAALTRPTLWAVGLLFAGVWLIRYRRALPSALRTRAVGWSLLAVVLIVSPWVVRNAVVLGRPILTTTHGGYTLALANNAVFDREVVAAEEPTTWSEASLYQWQADIAERHDIDWTDELASDAAYKSEARRFITRNPHRFLAGCWFRLRRFFGLTPSGPDGAALPAIVRVGIGAFYGIEFALACFGCLSIGNCTSVDRRTALVVCIVPVVAFACVHTIYWSNARMRAPVTPAIAVLAGFAISRRFQPPASRHSATESESS